MGRIFRRYCLSPQNIGDRGKFYWAEKVKGYHFFCDDDIEYSRHYFEYLSNKIEKYDRKAIVGIHGSLILSKDKSYYSPEGRKRFTFRTKNRPYDRQVDILGTGLIAFHSERITIPYKIFEASNMADVFLGLHARAKEIPLICCGLPAQMVQDVDNPPQDSIYSHSCDNKPTQLNVRAAVDQLIASRW